MRLAILIFFAATTAAWAGEEASGKKADAAAEDGKDATEDAEKSAAANRAMSRHDTPGLSLLVAIQ